MNSAPAHLRGLKWNSHRKTPAVEGELQFLGIQKDAEHGSSGVKGTAISSDQRGATSERETASSEQISAQQDPHMGSEDTV